MTASVAVMFLILFTSPASGQSPPSPVEGELNPLASKQDMIKERLKRFEDRVFRLREQIAQTEAENAARLARTLERATELGLSDRLGELVERLHGRSSTNEILDEQLRWITDADRVLAILLEQSADDAERREEIERLKKYAQRLDRILEEQLELREASGQSASEAQLRQQLDQAIKRIDGLLNRQSEISKRTEGSKNSDAAAQQKAAADQESLSRDAEELAEDLNRLSERKPQEKADSESQQSAREASKSASESTKTGAQSMQQAGERMNQGDEKSAAEPQKKAEQSLREARKKLEDARDSLNEKKEAAEQAEKQKKTAEQTGELSEQMKKNAQGQGKSQSGKSGKSGGKGKSESKPGEQNLDQAQKEMDEAAEELEHEKPAEAGKDQDQAIDQLEQAKKELEDALQQLRKEEKEEALRDLESRFREMLSKQRVINDATMLLSGMGRENFERTEELQAAELSSQQTKLAQSAEGCLHILDEDGTTIVFPRVVEQLAEDMNASAGRLAQLHVGLLTQRIQQEILETLEQLLAAVKQMQSENEQQVAGAQGAGGQQPSPLLPPSAEFKLLRSSQLRVNLRTSTIETSRREAVSRDDPLEEALRATANRQAECATIATDMRDRKKGP